MQRAKPKDIKTLREQYLSEQLGCCAICGEPIAQGEAVLDHCHRTGYLRAVLHRGCNAYIGHLENNMARNKITPKRLQAILTNFQMYVNSHRLVLHPTHRTPEEKKERAKIRAKKRRQSSQKR